MKKRNITSEQARIMWQHPECVLLRCNAQATQGNAACWIDGIDRASDGFALRLISERGRRSWHPAHRLSEVLPTVAQSHQQHVVTTLSDWSLTQPAQWLPAFGVNFSVTDDHELWTFDDASLGTTFLVPTAVLLEAFFSPLGALAARLFRPTGLETVCTFVGGSGSCQVAALSGVFAPSTGPPGTLAKLSWLTCFASARGMFSSVYVGATQGRLSLRPARAQIEAVLRGSLAEHRFVKRTMLVTSMKITSLTAAEEPYEFAKDHPTQFALTKRRVQKRSVWT